MTFSTRSFEPTDLSPAEIVHTATYGYTAPEANETVSMEAYKLEREHRAHYKRMRDMRAVGFGQRYGMCG